MADVPDRIPVSYAALPPLGYLPSAWTMSWCRADHPELHRYARLGNVIAGTLVICLTYCSGLLLFSRRPEIAVCAAWLVALHPELVFLSAYVNNDASVILATAVLWYLWIRLAKHGPSLCLFSGIGILAGITFLCKTNGAGVLVAGVPILAFQLWEERKNWSRVLGSILVIPLAALVVCGPWMLWSWHHHHSLWGLDVCRDWWLSFIAERGIDQGFLNGGNWESFVDGSWKSFWACFGYWSTWLPPVDYGLITAACGIALGALLARPESWTSSWGWSPLAWRGIVLAFLVGTVACLASHGMHSLSFGFSPQGRYLAPIALPVLMGMAVGFANLFQGRRSRHLGTAALIGMMGWLQVESMDAVQGSIRIRQGSRKVKAELLSNVAALPGESGYCSPTMAEWNGTVEFRKGQCLLGPTSKRSSLLWSLPVRATDLGWLVIEQHHVLGPLEKGRIAVRQCRDQSVKTMDGLSFHAVAGSMVRFTFDLREFAGAYGEELVQIGFEPPLGARIAVRQFQLLDRMREPVPIPTNLYSTPVTGVVHEFYTNRKQRKLAAWAR